MSTIHLLEHFTRKKERTRYLYLITQSIGETQLMVYLNWNYNETAAIALYNHERHIIRDDERLKIYYATVDDYKHKDTLEWLKTLLMQVIDGTKDELEAKAEEIIEFSLDCYYNPRTLYDGMGHYIIKHYYDKTEEGKKCRNLLRDYLKDIKVKSYY